MLGEDTEGGGLGPHGGQLIDLGRNRKYRVELVVDAPSGEVRLFVLDQRLREAAVVDQKAIVNLLVAGEVRTFEIPAVHTSGEHRAKAPSIVAFALADSELLEFLQTGKAESCKVRLMIDDKAYTGFLARNSIASKPTKAALRRH
jgi:hypothetical protein